jgi:5-formyltetrahydrofolate cyclo-ligase
VGSMGGVDKARLREYVRLQRTRRRESPDYVERVLEQADGRQICCYVALPGEPPTAAIIDALTARGDTVYLPIAHPGGAMTWTDASTSRPWRAWGVRGQPHGHLAEVALTAVDCVIVPALAVAPDGHRLGQGGGYYDRFLPRVPGARTVALIWSGELLDDVGAQPHDVAVDSWVVADE